MSGQSKIAALGARQLVDLYRRGELSPVEATEDALRRIEALNDRLNAFCLVDGERALEAARASESRYAGGKPEGLVDGVPVAIKDVFLTKGWPTYRGSLLTDEHQSWEDDAPVVAALRRDGAVFLGKTTTPELGWKGVTDSPRHGVTRNPWDPALTSGGSSGGSAVALATGMAPLALGTDGGGSIRIPASFCGISGLKPTYGRVPLWPASPYGTLAHAGPMARTVEDVALMLQVIAEPDARDWLALPSEGVDYVRELDGGVEGLRVAVSIDLGYAEVEPQIAAAVQAAAGVFEDLGAGVEEVELGLSDPLPAYRVLWDSGAAFATRQYTEEQRAKMDPGLAEITAEGARYTALEGLEAATDRAQLAIAMNRFHEEYDLLLTPTMPIPPFEAGREVPEGWPHRRWATWSPLTYPFNLTQQPAASVPCGFTSGGLPIGLQVVGAKYKDALVLRAAHAFQQATDHLQRPPATVEEE